MMIRTITRSARRHLRITPGFFLLIWRWSMWLYALIVVTWAPPELQGTQAYTMSKYVLVLTLAQTIVTTLAAPVFQIILPRPLRFNRLRAPFYRTRDRYGSGNGSANTGDSAEEMKPGQRPIQHWGSVLYVLDVLICGLATYLTGPFLQDPNFGVASPFYRYGVSTAFAATLAYGYRGGILAACGYDLFIVLGIFFPPSGPHYTSNILDIVGSLVDTPVAALVSGYLITLLTHYIQSKRREQDNVRSQAALLNVGETIVREATDQKRLLQRSAEQIRKGGHFQRVEVILLGDHTDGGHPMQGEEVEPQIETRVETTVSEMLPREEDDALLRTIVRNPQTLNTLTPLNDEHNGTYQRARLLVPLLRDGQVCMILQVEGRRQIPFDSKQERFLTIAGTQLMIALDNIRLSEQALQLAEMAERSRIAREIHDGIAQLVYMLSLNAETGATLVQRISEASEEDAELFAPLIKSLDNQVTLAKQALWETRTYMSSLKPLMNGTTTFTQMLTNQVREFSTISGLEVQLDITGEEAQPALLTTNEQRYAQVSMTLFRIVQEALTNAYKHAQATLIHVSVLFQREGITVEIKDNGRGLQRNGLDNSAYEGNVTHQRIYSGRGLESIRERVAELDGLVTLSSERGNGLAVNVHIPLPQTKKVQEGNGKDPSYAG